MPPKAGEGEEVMVRGGRGSWGLPMNPYNCIHLDKQAIKAGLLYLPANPPSLTTPRAGTPHRRPA